MTANLDPHANRPPGSLVERQHALDALRGLAAVSVVFIHTVYGSGVSYVPGWMRQLVLMFDVPVFFFLAGWALVR